MCSVDGEVATVWNSEARIARKVHHCSVCEYLITPGTNYLLIEALTDGSWGRAKLCFGCWVTYEEFGSAHRFWPWPGQLFEDLQACVSQDTTKPEARRWRDAMASFWRRCRLSPRGRNERRTHATYLLRRNRRLRRSA